MPRRQYAKGTFDQLQRCNDAGISPYWMACGPVFDDDFIRRYFDFPDSHNRMLIHWREWQPKDGTDFFILGSDYELYCGDEDGTVHDALFDSGWWSASDEIGVGVPFIVELETWYEEDETDRNEGNPDWKA